MSLRTVWLCLFCLAVPVTAIATCGKPTRNADHARTELRLAANQANLVQAKRYARQAERTLDAAAKEAAACTCDKAQATYRRAARYAHHARNARDTAQFSVALQRSLRAFDAARRAWRRCSEQ